MPNWFFNNANKVGNFELCKGVINYNILFNSYLTTTLELKKSSYEFITKTIM